MSNRKTKPKQQTAVSRMVSEQALNEADGDIKALSSFYLPTRKQVPSDAQIPSHKLMMQAGMIRSLARGLYTHLPLAQRVVNKVKQQTRDVMEANSASEVSMPILQPKKLWEQTDRWSSFGPEMIEVEDRHERRYGLAPTHEEVVTDLVSQDLESYRDVPLTLYQIGTKIRDEVRPRFGTMRCREFVMKDAYSFTLSRSDNERIYQAMDDAYRALLDRFGLDYRCVEAATGAMGGRDSHEYMVRAENGEDDVAICEGCDFAANVETIGERSDCPECGKALTTEAGIEVAHIFDLGTKYSEALNAVVTDENGTDQPLQMGCYGLGVSRLLPAVIEQNHDDSGIIWPAGLAPFTAYLLVADPSSNKQQRGARTVAHSLAQAGYDVLVDDRNERFGAKFNDADLIGIPTQFIIGQHYEDTDTVEAQLRADDVEAECEPGSVDRFVKQNLPEA